MNATDHEEDMTNSTFLARSSSNAAATKVVRNNTKANNRNNASRNRLLGGIGVGSSIKTGGRDGGSDDDGVGGVNPVDDL